MQKPAIAFTTQQFTPSTAPNQVQHQSVDQTFLHQCPQTSASHPIAHQE
ncbi:hypothetical protein [Nostoc sp.]